MTPFEDITLPAVEALGIEGFLDAHARALHNNVDPRRAAVLMLSVAAGLLAREVGRGQTANILHSLAGRVAERGHADTGDLEDWSR